MAMDAPQMMGVNCSAVGTTRSPVLVQCADTRLPRNPAAPQQRVAVRSTPDFRLANPEIELTVLSTPSPPPRQQTQAGGAEQRGAGSIEHPLSPGP